MAPKKITSQTQFRHCQFVENVEPDKIYPTILNHFQSSNNQIRYIKFQIERAPDTDRKHAQGFVAFNAQLRIGKYIPGREVKTIKSIFKLDSLHLDYANFPLDAIEYVGKKYNRCAIHDKCKCSYQELLLANCDVCTQECCSNRTLARWDEENSGPFEFGQYHRNQTNQSNNDQYSELYLEVAEEICEGRDVDKIILDYSKKVPYCKTPIGVDRVSKAFKKIRDKKNERCWKPCNIYVYGKPGTGKTYFGEMLFKKMNVYTKAPKEKWFNDYNGQEVVIFDDIYGNWFDWSKLLRILDRKVLEVEVKGGHVNFSPFYQYFSSNASLRKIYLNNDDEKNIINSNGQMVENQKEYMALARRFDYIIEYKKINDDKIPCQLPCNCCKLKRIFHKGSRDKFNRFEFLIRFNKDVTFKKAHSIIQDRKISGVLNMNANGKVFFIGNPKPDKNDFLISPCEDDKECDYIYYNDLVSDSDDDLEIEKSLLFDFSSESESSDNEVKIDKKRVIELEDDSSIVNSIDCSDYETRGNNSNKKCRIEQSNLETINCYETGESSSNSQQIGDELEQLEDEMTIQRSTFEQ